MHIVSYAYYRPYKKNFSSPAASTPSPVLSPPQLLAFFLQLLPLRALARLPALKNHTFYHRLFTPLVTLWYLLFQRLNPDHSLEAALLDARAGGANQLNRKLSRHLTSCSTASYSDARQRLPCQFLIQALQLMGRKITQFHQAALWNGFQLALLDGSTVRLRPYGNIPKEFPPHSNQHQKHTYWCLMRVVVSFCAFTGAALDCSWGSARLSEQALACEMFLRAATTYLFIGDRNFGVWSIAQAARAKQHQLLVRLTQSRASKLLGKTLRVGDYPVSWKLTKRNQLQPDLALDPIQGRLVVVQLKRPGFRSQKLFLFTTLQDVTRYPAADLLKLYGLRWHVELNLRYVKTQLQAAQLEAHSADMVRKEWLATLLAYNLIRAAMLCAALQQLLPPLSLSFSSCRKRLESWLHEFGRSKTGAIATWHKTLLEMSRCKLPRRLKPRPNEPRALRHLWERYPPLRGPRAKARKKVRPRAPKS